MIETEAIGSSEDESNEGGQVQPKFVPSGEYECANFWQRFAAIMIDGLIFLPIAVIVTYLEGYSKVLAIALAIPTALMSHLYAVYFNGQYGRTIGKRVMGTRVLKITGEAIAWREAWLRSSVDIAFASLSAVAVLVALYTIPDAEYYRESSFVRINTLVRLEPDWLSWTKTAGMLWAIGEILVMLCNPKRRALHDFLAGTVIVTDDGVPNREFYDAEQFKV